MTYEEQLMALATKFTAQLAPDMEVVWSDGHLVWKLDDGKTFIEVVSTLTIDEEWMHALCAKCIYKAREAMEW